jgi:hypothetical protein
MDTKWAYERTEENEVKLNRNRNSSGIPKKGYVWMRFSRTAAD